MMQPAGTQQIHGESAGRLRYRTIVADPPWPMGPPHGARTKSAKGGWGLYIGQTATNLPYRTMTLDELHAFPVRALAEPDAHLYLWTVNKFVEEAYELARSWGFKPGTLLTWCKAPMGIGMGWAHSLTTEHILFCRRGRLPYKTRVGSSWWSWKRGPHSAKPDAFLDMVEQVSPGPYVELFARRDRLGWDTWGDESLETGRDREVSIMPDSRHAEQLQEALLAVYREYPAEVTRVLELTLDGRQLLVKIKTEAEDG